MKPAESRKVAEELWGKEAEGRFPENQGWCELIRGFPDRVYFNKNTNEIVFVELKAGAHYFHGFQKQMICALMRGESSKALLVTYNTKKKIKVKEEDALSAEAYGWKGQKDYKII